jgi:hypothetical protein
MKTCALLLTALLLTVLVRVSAQQRAGIFGAARDSVGHVLAGAEVQVQSESTGAIWKQPTDNAGAYSVAGLPPGRYKVTIRMSGFRTVSRVGVLVDSDSGLAVDFTMALLSLHDSITVVSTHDDIDPSRGDSLLMTRSSAGSTLPANGADYRMLFDLMPGVVVTPAGVSDGGQFTSNGQRPNANEFRIDGVSVNGGLGGSTLPGSFPGLSLPAMSGLGNTENLGSPETSQSVELRSSGFDAESGERPGARALITTRSGTNNFHGDFFGHIRDESWNARDWFANGQGFSEYPRPSWYEGGATFGGPIWRDRTFFFVSAEGSHLDDYAAQLIPVPTLATRQNGSPALQALLDSFPYPTGPNLGGGMAAGLAGLITTGSVGSLSTRIDQSLGRHGALFFRFVDAPSRLVYSQITGSGVGSFNWSGATVGLTAEFWGMLHEVRLNHSWARLNSSTGGSTGDTVALAAAGLLPVTVTPTSISYNGGAYGNITSPLGPGAASGDVVQGLYGNVVLGLSIPGLGGFVSNNSGLARQTEWELRDTLSRRVGKHQIHTGIDGLRLAQQREGTVDTILGTASSLESVLNGDPLPVTYSQLYPRVDATTTASLFAQDTFDVSDTLNLVYGLRWEITPPGTGMAPNPVVSGLWTGTAWQTTQSGVINGSAPWTMHYGQVAPRIGLGWKLPWAGIVLRAGAGLFYDTTLGASIDPINGGPFNSWLLGSEGGGISGSPTAPGTSAAAPSGASASPDVERFLSGSYPGLQLPESWQWRTSLEKTLESAGVMSASYAGNLGRRLLGNEAYIDPSTGLLDSLVALTRNSSNYQALQVRYTGSPVRGLFASVAYTWSHSLDNGSEDSGIFLIHPGYQLSEAWASSDFDVRHTLTAALSGRIPHFGWTLSGILRARTGFPINITDAEQTLGEEFGNAARPDLVPGVPIWTNDPSVAGGRRLNPAAFSVPANGQQGSLGRNAIYGNGLAQIDVSLRRTFGLFWGIRLDAGVGIFNVLNHPAFADPIPFLSSPLFGQSTSMQNLMLGSGTPNTGMPPLFQTGGSRSAELSFRLSF